MPERRDIPPKPRCFTFVLLLFFGVLVCVCARARFFPPVLVLFRPKSRHEVTVPVD